MVKRKGQGERFYGTVTIGERGQIVIPAEAREAMGLKKGEKLLAFGMGSDMLGLTKLEQFEAHLANRLEAVRTLLKKTQSNPK